MRNRGVNWPVVALSAVAVALVTGIGYFLFSAERINLHPVTKCPIESVETMTSLAILIDASEPLPPSQLKNVSTKVFKRLEELSPYDHVVIFSVSPSPSRLLAPVFDMCKPNPDSGDAPFKKKFEQAAFRNLLEKAIQANEGLKPTSPIIDSLSSVGAQLAERNGEKHLVLVSDLIENSSLLSMYRSDWAVRADSPRVQKSRPMLDDVTIDVLWLLRSGEDRQTIDIRDWWENYLLESGGYLRSIRPLSGN